MEGRRGEVRTNRNGSSVSSEETREPRGSQQGIEAVHEREVGDIPHICCKVKVVGGREETRRRPRELKWERGRSSFAPVPP